ncbi:MAG: transcriptional regulator, partial [Gammaproteobacteria bacterium]|nr:transcriptional regulator [Gammaproteobacteria bacterium]
PELLKLVSGGQFRLKGSGWYETDFKTGKKKNVAGDSGSSSDSSGSGSSNNDSSSGSSAAAS